MTPEETAAALAAKDQELAAEKKLREDKEKELAQAQHTIVDLKKKKDPEPKVPETESLDGEAIKEAALKNTEEQLEKFKIEQSKDTFEDILATFKATPEEREKIREVYEKGIVKTGFNREAIRQDLENAVMIANKPKFETTMNELRAAAVSRGTQSGASAASQETDKPDQPNLSDADKVWIKQTAARLKLSEEAVTAQLLKNRGK